MVNLHSNWWRRLFSHEGFTALPELAAPADDADTRLAVWTALQSPEHRYPAYSDNL